MTTDIKVDSELGASIDGRGDLKTVHGDDQIIQRAVLISLDEAAEWRGDRGTREHAEAFRSSLETTLENDDDVDDDISVRVESIEGNDVSLIVTIGDRTYRVE